MPVVDMSFLASISFLKQGVSYCVFFFHAREMNNVEHLRSYLNDLCILAKFE